jgi:hypothetical protein
MPASVRCRTSRAHPAHLAGQSLQQALAGLEHRQDQSHRFHLLRQYHLSDQQRLSDRFDRAGPAHPQRRPCLSRLLHQYRLSGQSRLSRRDGRPGRVLRSDQLGLLGLRGRVRHPNPAGHDDRSHPDNR